MQNTLVQGMCGKTLALEPDFRIGFA
jgi:hypothetical protein